MLVILLSPHPKAPTHPSIPKVMQGREHAPIPYSYVVFTLDSHLSLSTNLGACQNETQ
jgi:hypothetical protein